MGCTASSSASATSIAILKSDVSLRHKRRPHLPLKDAQRLSKARVPLQVTTTDVFVNEVGGKNFKSGLCTPEWSLEDLCDQQALPPDMGMTRKHCRQLWRFMSEVSKNPTDFEAKIWRARNRSLQSLLPEEEEEMSASASASQRTNSGASGCGGNNTTTRKRLSL
mmetsp:Transcript_60250/g.143598  ORF Transcript_60250/g.143598 Transcript_60250/m.143598 type:complete len:165 (+) Transcript_60250:134-628(+)